MKYRNITDKSIEVEAMQYIKGSIAEIHKFMHKHLYGNFDGSFSWGSPEGSKTAHFGDYIIKDVNGELRSCKPDIFGRTYEKVE